MSKRHKQSAKSAGKSPRRDKPAAEHDDAESPPALEPHPPPKRPLVLGICVVLFTLWLLFLLITAWPR